MRLIFNDVSVAAIVAVCFFSGARVLGAPPSDDDGRWDVGEFSAQLAPLLSAMETAVLAGDQAAYLACVDLTDPIFAREQRNWAKDLARIKPERFSIEVRDAVDDGEDKMTATVTFTWKVGGSEPLDRTITFPAVFVSSPADVDAAHGWLYGGERWSETRAEGVRVLYADGLQEIAKRVAALLPDVRTHVHEGFDVVVPHDQTVKLYNSMKLLQQSIYLSYADPLSGWNEPGESIKLLTGRRSGAGELKMLLAHEYGHVVTFEMGDKASGAPWWVLEGAAELAAEKYAGRGFERMVKRWAEQDRLVPWERMADFHDARDEDTVFVYNQGHHMVAYVSERFGRDSRNRWLGLMAKGSSLDDATRDALARSFAELDQEWRRSLTGATEAPSGAE